jgi:hypothetical protein
VKIQKQRKSRTAIRSCDVRPQKTSHETCFFLGHHLAKGIGKEGFFLGGGCSPAKPVSNAGTGNFLKISGQNRLSASGQLLVIGNSDVIQISYTAIQALSCYSAEQAVEARQQAMHAGYQALLNLRAGDNERRIAQLAASPPWRRH